jgi:hypothetical protein
MSENAFYPHVSVDCVIMGFDGFSLNVLLLKRAGKDGDVFYHDMKLPGSLIYSDEDLDKAAQRIINELFISKGLFIRQFHSFGSPDRTSNPRDIQWLEDAVKLKIDRIVTIGYLALCWIDKRMRFKSEEVEAIWLPVHQVSQLAFDHTSILQEALQEVRRYLRLDPSILVNLLPSRFTASQMRRLFEQLSGKPLDVRNFHKKLNRMEYIIPMDEFEQGVSHRAARFYRFDKKMLHKTYFGFPHLDK